MQLIADFKFFFDKSAVSKAIDAATKKVLSRQGSFVRTAARSRIKRRKKSAKPGQSPSAHSDLIKRIFFQYEPANQSVVIGFGKLNAKPKGQTGTSLTVPEILEYGGTGKVWKTGKTATWHAFPTMGPALEETLPKFTDAWKDSL